MKTKPKYKKSNLLTPKQREEMLIDAAGKASLMIDICVLHDCFDFEEKDLNAFIDRRKELFESMDEGNDKWEMMNKEIFERFGIKIV